MDKNEAYKWVAKKVLRQVKWQAYFISTLANTSAILKEYFPNFFWVGFYFVQPEHLLMGPFQGPPACVKLKLDHGVCAHAVARRETIVVPDVHAFPGHVACDERAKSEIAVPVFDQDGILRAVLDVDSASVNDFSDEDVQGLEAVAQLLRSIWPPQ